MTDEARTKRSRKRLWVGVTTGVVLLAMAAGAVLYLRSASFADLVRRKLVGALQDATGGRVEMASFHWNLLQLAFEAGDLTIHGLEPPGQLPYVHVDRVQVHLHVISLLERQFSIERVDLQRPVVHLIVNPDGSTNAPQPKLRALSGTSTVQEFIDLKIGRAELRHGELVINERRLPLDLSANDVLVGMSYDVGVPRHQYLGRVQTGKIDVKYQDLRAIPAAVDFQFALRDNALEVQSLKLTSQDSSLAASGKLTNFEQPEVQLTYAADVDVMQLGAITRSPQLRNGTMRLNGSGRYSRVSDYAANGHVAFRDFDYVEDPIALRKSSLDANFVLAPDRLELNRIAARVFGGMVTGDAVIKNPISTVPAFAPSQRANVSQRGPRSSQEERGVLAAEQQGSARLRVSGLSLNELIRMVSSRSLPLDELNAAGSVTGTVNLEWRQLLANAVADLALDITAPARLDANQLPVSGTVRGRTALRSERIDLAVLDLATPHTHLDATGSLGSTSATLKLKAETTNLVELQPLISGEAPLPVQLNGKASFDGTLSGHLRTPQIAGHVQATNFTYSYTPEASPSEAQTAPTLVQGKRFGGRSARQPAPSPQPAAPPRQIHVDSLAGDVQYSQTALSLHNTVVREGEAQLGIDGNIALDKGSWTKNSEFQVRAGLRNGDVTELQRIAGLSYPLQGQLSFSVQAAGTPANPHGQGQFSLAQAEVRNRQIHALTSKIAFADHAVQFSDIHLRAGNGTVAGLAAYNFRTREGQLDLHGQNVDLADFPEIQTERLHVEGVASFTVRGSGSLDHPLLNAHLDIDKLTLNDEFIGAATADAVTQGRQLTLTARSRFPHASFTLDGNAELEGDMPANAVLHFANLDVNPFLPAKIREQVTRQASLDGQAVLSGPLKRPRALHGTVNIQQFSVEVQHIPLRSDGPVQLSFADGVLAIQHCGISSDDTHFVMIGTASLQEPYSLNLSAQGTVNLKLAETLNSDVNSYGVAKIDLAVAGTVAQPAMTGRIVIEHAGLSFIDLPAGLGDVNGTLVFNQNRLDAQNLTGRMGGGHVAVTGFVTLGSTLGFNVGLDGSDIRFRYSGISVTSNQSLRLTGTSQNALLAGNITVTRFAQIPSSDLQFLLSQASAPPAVPNPKSPANNLHLDIRILSTPELTVETSLAKLSGDVDLRLRGTAERPALLGRINIAEGDVKLAGTKYHLDRGDITFLNPVRIDPVLDVEATTRIRDYDITIGLHGTMERLNTTYRSDPPLSTDDIVSLLAFGKTQTEQSLGSVGSSTPGFAESASGALLTSALNQATGNRVSRIFGASTIRINPSVGGPENDPNARLTLEQQVSNDVTFIYITNLARSAQEVIQIEYNINSDYTLEGIRDENGVVSFDLLIRKRKK